MLITKIPSKLTHALASARLSVNAILESAKTAVEAMVDEMLRASGRMGAAQPAMALIPVDRQRHFVSGQSAIGHGSVIGNVNAAPIGVNAHAAVCMYADPVTKAWRVLDFGKTTTGKTGHSQPSRFAP